MSEIDVSIIVPCYNEERRIAGLLEAIYEQTVSTSRLEVVIADGMSEDNTRQVIQHFAASHPNLVIKVIDNPKRNIPAALNIALNEASGTFLVRLDAHSIPNNDYIERCIQHLEKETAQNVGGIWLIEPGDTTKVAQAIAQAAKHPLGVGGAQYRDASATADFVDTVPFGSFKRKYLVDIGAYDETLLSNEDYELNTRIRNSGGKVFLDPSIQCTYFARSTYKALSKQYFRYGFWKFHMLRRYPDSLRWRQFLPPALVLGFSVLLIISIFIPLMWIIFGTLTLLYVFSLFFGVFLINKQKNSLYDKLLTTIAIITMHFSWGTGLIYSALKHSFKVKP